MHEARFCFAQQLGRCGHDEAPFILAGELSSALLDLDRDGALLADMSGVVRLDQECAFLTFAMLTKMIGHDLFRDKHLVVVHAAPRVLAALDKAIDGVGEAYMVYNPDADRTEIRGQGFTPALAEAYNFVASAEGAVDAGLVGSGLGIARTAASTRLNELHRWGFLVKSSRGVTEGQAKRTARRAVGFAAFSPAAQYRATNVCVSEAGEVPALVG